MATGTGPDPRPLARCQLLRQRGAFPATVPAARPWLRPRPGPAAGYLGDDQCVPRPVRLPAAGSSSAPVSQGGERPLRSRPDRRQGAEQDCGQHRYRAREAERRAIDPDLAEPGDACGADGGEGSNRQVREEHAHHTAGVPGTQMLEAALELEAQLDAGAELR